MPPLNSPTVLLIVFLFVFCTQGLCMPGAGHRENVRLQKAGEETHQKEERRVHGAEWEADSGESQQSVCCKHLKCLFHSILHVFCWSVTLSFYLFRTYVFYKKNGEVAVVLTSDFGLIRSQRSCFCHFLWDHRRSECLFWILKFRQIKAWRSDVVRL